MVILFCTFCCFSISQLNWTAILNFCFNGYLNPTYQIIIHRRRTVRLIKQLVDSSKYIQIRGMLKSRKRHRKCYLGFGWKFQSYS